ncbi:alpha/beta-hydrolase [Exidia glandulosa HHB12029]|uniref:Dipeptidyl-peptidase V n=1 Tax=Exidia glandulosa HHB12029 TaxID=1314781 RepID=A0A165M3D4_EXIGL|nr:alpha/beta-hydrolase [Exidia glandulosa HHB12029]
MAQSFAFDFTKLNYTTPNDKIRAVGVPDVPQRILDGLKKYEDSSRGYDAYGFEHNSHNGRGTILVDHRPEDAQVAKVYRMPVDPASGELEKITYFDLGTGRVISSITPIKGDDWRGTLRSGGAIMGMDVDGKEFFQFWRMWEDSESETVIPHIDGELDNKPSTIRIERLTHDDSIRFTSLLPSQTEDFFLFSSTEDGPAEWHVYMTRLSDSKTGLSSSSTAAFDLPRTRITAKATNGRVHWDASSVSLDNKYVLLTDMKGETYRPLYVLDISDPAALPAQPERLILPGATEREEETSHSWISFSRDAATPHLVYIITDAYGDFRSTLVFDLDSRTVLRHITASEPSLNAIRAIPWNIKRHVVLKDMLYMIANIDGQNAHYVMPISGAHKHEVIDVKFDGDGADSSSFYPSFNGKNGRAYEICYRLASYRSSGGLAYADLGPALERVQTDSEGKSFIVVTLKLYKQAQPVAPAFKTVPPKVIKFKSFDGLEVPFVYYHPCEGKKRVPVNIEIHGGPSWQSTSLRKSRIHGYLINELECAVLYPNVRGSIGYGRKYMMADDVYLREDSVKDIGAFIDYIGEHMKDELDAGKIFVSGESYGGFMTFACLTHYSNKLACGLATCGIADWVTFLSNTAAHRQDNRRHEYGDETDPDVRAFLQRISPASNADKITAPLWIAHGDNDTRVPFEQAYFMYDSCVKRGIHAELIACVNEGHGFNQKSVLEYVSGSKILFLERFFAKGSAV